jgi:hypothetical protein
MAELLRAREKKSGSCCHGIMLGQQYSAIISIRSLDRRVFIIETQFSVKHELVVN